MQPPSGHTSAARSPAGLDLDRAEEALESIGYSKAVLHRLDCWESERTTGRFGNQGASRQAFLAKNRYFAP